MPLAKLSPEQVLAIFNDERRAGDTANDYGVCRETVNSIWRKRIWRKVTANLLDRPLRCTPKAPSRPKLTPAQVRAILKDNRTSVAIARAYGVSPGTIRSIRTGRCWVSVTKGLHVAAHRMSGRPKKRKKKKRPASSQLNRLPGEAIEAGLGKPDCE